jgi:hypothetical protein
MECAFTDTAGYEHKFVEKVPVVTTDELYSDSTYPRPCEIVCTLISERPRLNGQVLMRVDTTWPWGLESINGQSQFEVLREEISEI